MKISFAFVLAGIPAKTLRWPRAGLKGQPGHRSEAYIWPGFPLKPHPFTIIRSPRRRTMQLSVGVRGVEVRAPRWVADSEIREFVAQKHDWIERAVQQAGLRQARSSEIFSSGGIFYVLGQEYHLEVLAAEAGRPFLEELPLRWRIKGDRTEIRKLLTKWYRLKAEKVLGSMVVQWAQQMSIEPPGIVIKEQSRLWGSYSARTCCVNLNWRMVAFPLAIIEYIVVHELCHARHLNHSRAFWNEVGRFCPEWRARRLWLRCSAQKYLF